jgi:2-polyprenyl-6-hydroxyphenyl methylase/3-demethylubiquinone-9 3-methyltransferase
MAYYREKLSADRLANCYELAGDRIRQYLMAESNAVASLVADGQRVLELGCGYGRLFPHFDNKRIELWGIDYAIENLLYARRFLKNFDRVRFACMDAIKLGFTDETFDLVYCIQNGICAFNVDEKQLLKESKRVTARGGKVIFSTYSDKIWEARVEWFEQQAGAGLLGEIDYEQTTNGRIVCKDGFSSGRLTRDDFSQLTFGIDGSVTITEVDNSSLFCIIEKS